MDPLVLEYYNRFPLMLVIFFFFDLLAPHLTMFGTDKSTLEVVAIPEQTNRHINDDELIPGTEIMRDGADGVERVVYVTHEHDIEY